MARDPEERLSIGTGTITVAELRARCSVLEPGIVLFHELNGGTVETYKVLLETAERLGGQFDRWAMVVDLTEVKVRPKGEYLELIRNRPIRSLGLDGQPLALAIIQPTNAFLRTVLRFVLGRLSPSVRVCATREAALDACRQALRDRAGVVT